MVKSIGGDRSIRNKTLDPEKYGMVVCPLCKGKGFIINPKRECCEKCGGFGFIKKENGPEGDG